jgi:hypothetical protein
MSALHKSQTYANEVTSAEHNNSKLENFFPVNLKLGHWDCSRTGLPDGIVSNQKSRFGYILEGLAVKDVGILYGHLVHFTAIWFIF